MVKDDYSGAVGGGLKFKGDGVKKKKKKHSSKAKDADKAEALEKVVDKAKEGEEGSDFISLEKNETENELAAEELRELRESRMTESERAFARIKRERMLKDKHESLKSYEERKQQFAKSLAEAPEHNDMPKVGPG